MIERNEHCRRRVRNPPTPTRTRARAGPHGCDYMAQGLVLRANQVECKTLFFMPHCDREMCACLFRCRAEVSTLAELTHRCRQTTTWSLLICGQMGPVQAQLWIRWRCRSRA